MLKYNNWLLIAFAICTIFNVNAFEKVNYENPPGEKQGETAGTARFPSCSPDGKWIAFSMYGDIWKVPADGGRAQRLTFHQADDVKPRWSPDGRSIAFASNRAGNFDIWIIDENGGKPEQLTFHSMWDSIADWTPDGRWLIFYSYRSGKIDLWKIKREGGAVYQVTFDGGRDASFSPDGSAIVYTRGDASMWRKGYMGSSNWDIYFLSQGKKVPQQLTDYYGNDLNPYFSADGKFVYFVREVNIAGKEGKVEPVYNLWKKNLADKKEEQVTKFDSDIIGLYFSFNRTKVVFEKDFQIWQMKVGEWKPSVVKIEIESDSKSNEKVTRIISEGNEMGHWSPNSEKIVFVINGDIWMMSASGGKATRITQGPSKDQWPRFSPDGKRIAYFSDKSGNDDIYVLNLETSQEIQLTKDKSSDFFHCWSADGKYLVFTSERSGNRDLWMISSTGGSAEKLTDSPESEDDAAVSPDGKWLAFDSGKTGKQEIWLMPFGKNFDKAVQITKHNQLTQVPTWSPDSQWLVYETHDSDGSSSIRLISRKGGESMQVAIDAMLPCWSSNGKRILFESEREKKKNLYTIEAPKELYLGKRIPFMAQVEVDLHEERKQVFEEAWRAIAQGFYDSDFHGVNWAEIKVKYQKAVEESRTDLELQVLINRMAGELKTSHTGITGRAGKNDVNTGYLGWKLEPVAGKKVLQVVELLRDGPADKVWIRRGDFIYQIGEEIISSDTNISKLLNNTVNKQVKIFVSPSMNPEDGRYINVKPIAIQDIEAIKYRQWLMRNIRLVRKQCQGKVIYIHLTEMNPENLVKFRQLVQKTVDRADGMILDVRNNGGGLIHRELLDILVKKPYVAYKARGQKDKSFQPSLYWNKPVVVLINEKSFSDAEVFAYSFQALKRGYLVGVPTAGGVIGTRDIILSNQNSFRVPRVGYYTLDGKNLEGFGVKPDFFVMEKSEDRLKDQDPQLMTATKIIMQVIAGKTPKVHSK